MSSTLLATPLRDFHLEHGGKMVDFAGWEMPLYYQRPSAEPGAGGLTDEHRQTRSSGAIFDVSHMGRLGVSGRHARRFLERVCSRRITDMKPGQCRYALVCNERGGVHDDVIVYRQDEDEFLVVVNASNRAKIVAHFEKVIADAQMIVKLEDRTRATAMVAIQGPRVIEYVRRFSSEIPSLKRYAFTTKNLLIMKLLVSRTGYTGEDGIEVILPANMVSMAMGLLLKDADLRKPDAVIRPAGLGARDTLRTEAAMPLYGHELGEDINALSCGVDFAISMDKDQAERGEVFIGQEALRATLAQGGPARKLAGLALEGKRSARQGMKVLVGDKPAGEVTSGCPSPTLGFPIAMAFLDREHLAPGTSVEIDTGRDRLAAKVVPLPFYKAPKPAAPVQPAPAKV